MASSAENLEFDGSLNTLENRNGLVVGRAVETSTVDGDQFVAASELAFESSWTAVKHRLDVDRQIAVRTSITADNWKPETLFAFL